MSILFFHFDGTSNSPQDVAHYHVSDTSISNVLKSHILLSGSTCLDSPHSRLPKGGRSFYYSGIGTYGSVLARCVNASLAIEQGDVASILRQAMLDFQTYYHRRIHTIVLIGFSRGAALARRFAALLEPVLERALVVEAVMDTVASIGWPSLDYEDRPTTDVVFEHGHTLPSCVRKALHLVALDEQRLAFRPTLMNHDARVSEWWLPGVHSDVGGGYRYDGLADVSLDLLIGWLTKVLGHDYYLKPNDIHSEGGAISAQMLALRPNVLGKIHYQQRTFLWQSLTLAPRQSCVLMSGKPCQNKGAVWHPVVFSRMASALNYWPMAVCPIRSVRTLNVR